MEKQLKDEILESLANFTGTEQIWEHRTFAGSIYLTDGCNFLREKTQSRWLFDLIFSFQQKLKNEDFQCWKLVRLKNNEFEIKCLNGDENFLVDQHIPFSDFVLDELIIWVIRDRELICLLPNEY